MTIFTSSFARSFLVACALLVCAAGAQGQETRPESAPSPAHEIPRLQPGSTDAKPLTVYQWTAEAGANDEHDGLRFTWCLPRGFTPTEPYDLVVVCHGTGLDYRWGHANLGPEEFRPGNIVVCVDGTSEADDGTRVFLGERRDALDFRDFVLEMTRSFPVDRIFLYGHSQGGFFVQYVAGQFPGLTEGVVAHASGTWTQTNLQGGIQSVPIAFLHGTADPVVPYFESLAAREAYRDAGHTMLLVRRMQGYTHWPNAVRASECLDWCSGMTATRADTALAAAASMLAPKPKDHYGYECPVPFGGAYRVLQRVAKEGGNAIEEEVTAEQTRKATDLMKRIDDEGRRHVEALRADVKSRDDLVLGLGADAGAWLGHLVAMREDFRGVPSVEAYIQEIGYDAAAKDQWETGRRLLDMWTADRPEKQKFEAVADSLGECFLLDAIPSDLPLQMAAWKDRAAELQLTEESLEKYAAVTMWDRAWKNGYARYRNLCLQWKAPAP